MNTFKEGDIVKYTNEYLDKYSSSSSSSISVKLKYDSRIGMRVLNQHYDSILNGEYLMQCVVKYGHHEDLVYVESNTVELVDRDLHYLDCKQYEVLNTIMYLKSFSQSDQNKTEVVEKANSIINMIKEVMNIEDFESAARFVMDNEVSKED